MMMRAHLCRSFLLALLIASTGAAQEGTAARYRAPVLLDDGWKTANADSLGVDSERLAKLTELLRAWPELGVHAILIERNGRLIYEEYFDGFDERWGQPLGRVSMTTESKHDLRSMTKSVVSALVGIAVGTGAITLGARILRQHVIPAVRTGARTGCPGS